MILCESCGENVDDILYTCPGCRNMICNNCSIICKKCHEHFCAACFLDHKNECK